MAAGWYKIVAEQGADYAEVITWKDSAGTLVDLSGRTAKMQVRKSKSDSSVALELSTENGRITLTTTINLAVPATVTSTLVPDVYAYDLEIYSQGSTVRLLEGTFTVSGEVTR